MSWRQFVLKVPLFYSAYKGKASYDRHRVYSLFWNARIFIQTPISHLLLLQEPTLFARLFPLPPAGSSKLNVIPDSSLSLYPACPTDVLVVQRCLLESGPPLSTAPLRAPHLASLARIWQQLPCWSVCFQLCPPESLFPLWLQSHPSKTKTQSCPLSLQILLQTLHLT